MCAFLSSAPFEGLNETWDLKIGWTVAVLTCGVFSLLIWLLFVTSMLFVESYFLFDYWLLIRF